MATNETPEEATACAGAYEGTTIVIGRQIAGEPMSYANRVRKLEDVMGATVEPPHIVVHFIDPRGMVSALDMTTKARFEPGGDEPEEQFRDRVRRTSLATKPFRATKPARTGGIATG